MSSGQELFSSRLFIVLALRGRESITICVMTDLIITIHNEDISLLAKLGSIRRDRISFPTRKKIYLSIFEHLVTSVEEVVLSTK